MKRLFNHSCYLSFYYFFNRKVRDTLCLASQSTMAASAIHTCVHPNTPNIHLFTVSPAEDVTVTQVVKKITFDTFKGNAPQLAATLCS